MAEWIFGENFPQNLVFLEYLWYNTINSAAKNADGTRRIALKDETKNVEETELTETDTPTAAPTEENK